MIYRLLQQQRRRGEVQEDEFVTDRRDGERRQGERERGRDGEVLHL